MMADVPRRPLRDDAIVATDAIGTVAFLVSAVIAAALFDTPSRWAGAIVALLLFAAGVFAFLWGYWTSVQRSRTEEISVVELFFLIGPATPMRTKLVLNGLLLAQCTIAVATALARSSTDGKPGSSLAFGILVPMFGLGLNGLWVARHGRFGPRRLRQPVPQPDAQMEQNAPHG